MATSLDPKTVTTANEPYGYRVVRPVGIVRGVVVQAERVRQPRG